MNSSVLGSIGYIPKDAKSFGISLSLANANNVVVPVDFQLPLDLKQAYKELCEKIKPSLELDNLIPEAKAIIDNSEGLCTPIP